jgi:flavin reductase (DIM6/NTAB) family NADH-FMN oxidoreductase RutF
MQKNTVWQQADLQALPKDYRTQLINSITGFKPANLVGTQDGRGQTNLAIFSSAVHLGADPALMGLVSRPFTPTVSRHSLDNMKELGYFTLNHVHESFYEQAHQTSARYAKEVSEFAATGLREEYLGDFPAPFVAEARVKIGLKLLEIIPIHWNNTHFIIGQVELLQVPTDCLEADGKLNLERAGTVAVSGLDTYHRTEQLQRLPYAKAK